MHSTSNIKNDMPRGKLGWNRRGFRWDKSSKAYQDYRRKMRESTSKKARRRLEELAKRPLLDRNYKSKATIMSEEKTEKLYTARQIWAAKRIYWVTSYKALLKYIS